jgi:hypothetical protein
MTESLLGGWPRTALSQGAGAGGWPTFTFFVKVGTMRPAVTNGNLDAGGIVPALQKPQRWASHQR